MRPSLYEFAGGAPAFVALAEANHVRCLADPELNHPFSHPDGDPDHIEHLASYWAQVLGGPVAYDGGHAKMLHLHAGNGDMSDLGRRFVDCFVGAMDDAGLPDDPAFRTAMRDYMVWAVADVLDHEDHDSIDDAAPMPRWSWDGLVP